MCSLAHSRRPALHCNTCVNMSQMVEAAHGFLLQFWMLLWVCSGQCLPQVSRPNLQATLSLIFKHSCVWFIVVKVKVYWLQGYRCNTMCQGLGRRFHL